MGDYKIINNFKSSILILKKSKWPSIYHVDSLEGEGGMEKLHASPRGGGLYYRIHVDIRYPKSAKITLFRLTFSSKSEFSANSSLLLASLLLKTNNIYIFIKYVTWRGVKKLWKIVHVVYGWPLNVNSNDSEPANVIGCIHIVFNLETWKLNKIVYFLLLCWLLQIFLCVE